MNTIKVHLAFSRHLGDAFSTQKVAVKLALHFLIVRLGRTAHADCASARYCLVEQTPETLRPPTTRARVPLATQTSAQTLLRRPASTYRSSLRVDGRMRHS